MRRMVHLHSFSRAFTIPDRRFRKSACRFSLISVDNINSKSNLKCRARLILFMCDFTTERRTQRLIYVIFIQKNTNVLFLLPVFLATALQMIELQNSETTRPQVLLKLENICMKFLEMLTEKWQCMAGQ
jgi:hypothetical protein